MAHHNNAISTTNKAYLISRKAHNIKYLNNNSSHNNMFTLLNICIYMGMLSLLWKEKVACISRGISYLISIICISNARRSGAARHRGGRRVRWNIAIAFAALLSNYHAHLYRRHLWHTRSARRASAYKHRRLARK